MSVCNPYYSDRPAPDPIGCSDDDLIDWALATCEECGAKDKTAAIDGICSTCARLCPCDLARLEAENPVPASVTWTPEALERLLDDVTTGRAAR